MIQDKNSLVMTLTPSFYSERETSPHAYAIIYYNEQNCKTLLSQLYTKVLCFGWIQLINLKKRCLGICSPHSKYMYKSDFNRAKQIIISHLDRVTRKPVWKGFITKLSTFMIFFSYSHKVRSGGLTVTNFYSGNRYKEPIALFFYW